MDGAQHCDRCLCVRQRTSSVVMVTGGGGDGGASLKSKWQKALDKKQLERNRGEVMKFVYGSQSPDGASVEVAVDKSMAAPARSQLVKKKNVLAALGVSLFIGGAFVAFQATSASLNTAAQMEKISTGEGPSMLQMNLNANIAAPMYNVPDALLSGSEILLRMRGKNGLCMDDGGAMTQGEKKFSAQPCNPNNPNQLFVYDRKAYQLRSARKNNLCVDDGNANKAGEGNVQLWGCDPNNLNQRFVFDEKTLMLRNPAKNNLCIDDGGNTLPGQNLFLMWDCIDGSPNQHFEVVSQSALAAEKVKILEGVMGGTKFIMRIPGKNNLCVDDGNSQTAASSKFSVWNCDTANPNQVFVYNAATKRIQSVKKQGLCIDDGGGQRAAQSQFVLWYCDPANKNQDFVYDPKTLLMRNPNKDNLCMDDGAAYSAGAGPKFTLWYCDVFNPNQHFEFILIPDPPTVMPPVKIPIAPTDWETGGSLVAAPPTIMRQPLRPIDLTDDKTSGGVISLPPVLQSMAPIDPSNGKTGGGVVVLPPVQDGSSGTDGDWNLLSPSHTTISHVNADKLTPITSDEIFQFLAKIKDEAEMEFDVSKYKYARTFNCVSAGLKSLGKDFVSEYEYHALVQWMFAHCAASSDNVGFSSGSSNSTIPGALTQNATDSDGSHMTKLEFYYEIKDHFTGHRETMFGSATAVHLRSTLARAQEQKLADCIKAASVRFGIYGTENRDQYFESAIAWVRDECAAA